MCDADASGDKYCVAACDPTKPSCPSGFSCQTVGSGGVCWPGANNGGGGGCEAGGSGGAPIALFLGIAALLITRRRR
jgi:uncharacterized protein (TIGR03382 family)